MGDLKLSSYSRIIVFELGDQKVQMNLTTMGDIYPIQPIGVVPYAIDFCLNKTHLVSWAVLCKDDKSATLIFKLRKSQITMLRYAGCRKAAA